MSSVIIADLGCANTASVVMAFERLGQRVILSQELQTIQSADRLILPGVGAASYIMKRIHELGLFETLLGFKRPLLGICLGQQILFEQSEEGGCDCLGLLKGRVTALKPSPDLVVPHMGWNQLNPIKDHELLQAIAPEDYAYFVHSYACPVTEDTVATTTYGGDFAAIVARENIMGCQFHPERSSTVGARILSNFLKL
jgi:imidazole glycerol-phosphate synthase subunit HisH